MLQAVLDRYDPSLHPDSNTIHHIIVDILRSTRTVRFIREELRGRRLAGTNGGLPSTVDNLAEVANCSAERLDKLYTRHGL